MKVSQNRLSNHAVSQLQGPNRATALAALRRAVELDPKSQAIRANLSVALTNFGEYAEASKILHGLVTEDTGHVAAWHSYGVLGLVSAFPEDAVECFKACMLLDPSNYMYKFDHAIALMQAGRWEEGWRAYECRREYKSERSFKDIPRWDGSHGKDIFVWAEQGIGDTFQFSRYLPLLAKISKRVTFGVPAQLANLFKPYSEHADLLVLGTQLPDSIECEVSLMSLPLHLGPSPAEWPADPGLLGSNITATVPDSNFRVGLCWACSPSSANHRERSVNFTDMLQLTRHSNIDFYSLQVGAAAADIANAQAQLLITDLSDKLTDDWCATAAAIKSVDMVVSTDTSVAHLAALMGKPTIMLIARRDWWRWGNSGTKTAWYPTMHIIRQARPYSWAAETEQASALIGQAARERSESQAA